nr:MAG TPA: hypothetical protein [Caudoviricetes sp.]
MNQSFFVMLSAYKFCFYCCNQFFETITAYSNPNDKLLI